MLKVRTSRSSFATSRQGNNSWPTTQPIWYARTSKGGLNPGTLGSYRRARASQPRISAKHGARGLDAVLRPAVWILPLIFLALHQTWHTNWRTGDRDVAAAEGRGFLGIQVRPSRRR